MTEGGAGPSSIAIVPTRSALGALMARAVELGEQARSVARPNPWVGCVVVGASGARYEGATSAPGGPHAEAVALRAAGTDAKGGLAVVTLEPCAHHGRTPPCADALVDAGVETVVVGVSDPDSRVRGRGIERLRNAGVAVHEGILAELVAEQLDAYLLHRRLGRPRVVVKLAVTADGRLAAPDGSSAWITGPAAREDAHRLRAQSDAILVGAGTVRRDDPALTVRLGSATPARQPRRLVLGHLPEGARVEPAEQVAGDLGSLLERLGREGVLQLLVEGGARTAKAFLDAELVDRLVLYLAPALSGGDDGVPVFSGPGAASIEGFRRWRLAGTERVGGDVRVELAARTAASWAAREVRAEGEEPPCSPG